MVTMQGINSNTLKKKKQAPIQSTLDHTTISADHHLEIDEDSLAVVTVDKHGKVQLRMRHHLRPHITQKFLNNSQRNFTNALHQALTGIQSNDRPAELANVRHAYEYDCASAPMPITRSTRSGRVLPQRGGPIDIQSSVDQHPSPSFGLGHNGIKADGSDDEVDEVPPPPRRTTPKVTKMKSVLIANEEQVKSFLLDRLDRIQQLSDKKIAKAWIKGICPKKQAEYPYQNKRAPGVDTRLPPFWPSDVKYKEPDHIQKEDRNRLLLHLIRLRPSPEEVRGWNRNQVSLNKTHETVGWTAFLRELAPPECVDDIDNVKPEKVKKRKEYMKQMYDVALQEEEFRYFGMGDETLKYSYPDDDKPVKRHTARQKKRARSPQSTTDDEYRSASGSSSASRKDRLIAKLHRHGSDAKRIMPAPQPRRVSGTAPASGETQPVVRNKHEEMVEAGVVDMTSREQEIRSPLAVDQETAHRQPANIRHGDRSQPGLPTDADWLASRREVAAMHQINVGATTVAESQYTEQRRQEEHQQQQLLQWQTATPVTMSFTSTSEPASPPTFDVYQAQTGQSIFPGKHDFRFDTSQDPSEQQPLVTPYTHQQHHDHAQEQHLHPLHTHHHHHDMQGAPMPEAYPVFEVPHPTFEPAPGTPFFSPVGMFAQNLPMSVPHEMMAVPAHLHTQQPAVPPQAQPNQQHIFSPVYDHHKFHYPSPGHHRQTYASSTQPYEPNHPSFQHGLPLQSPHGWPLNFMPASMSYRNHAR